MAGIGEGLDWQARCFREKRARKRVARGVDSLVRVLRRVRVVGSSAGVWGGGVVADGVILLAEDGFLFCV